MDVLAQAWADTDQTSVAAEVVANAGYVGNPNVVFIPLLPGNVYLDRYLRVDHIADFEQGVKWLDLPVAAQPVIRSN